MLNINTVNKRVVVILWKNRGDNPLEIFSNLKNLCLSYPQYNYNTLNNYLSKEKVAYENDTVRIERKNVFLRPKTNNELQARKIIPVVRRVQLKEIHEATDDLEYWLQQPVINRAVAVTFIISQSLKKGERMNKTIVNKKEIERMTLAQDFEDFVKLLNKYCVAYMVVGGYALAFHGKPRHTGDLDIWINVSENNAARMLKVLKEFGMASIGFKKNDFLKQGYVTQIGYPPLRIDILNSIDGIEFNEAVKNMQKLIVNDTLEIAYIGIREFIINKQASGRSQDLTDIKEIRKKKPPSKRKK